MEISLLDCGCIIGCFYLPVGTERFDQAILEGLQDNSVLGVKKTATFV